MSARKQRRDTYHGKYIMGLDVGVGSLGIALISDYDNGDAPEIIAGTAITYPSAEDNSERRTHRGSRTRFKRRRARKTLLRQHLADLLQLPDANIDKTHMSHLYIHSAENPTSVNALRAKALKQACSKEELLRIFMHLTSHRGVRLTKAVNQEAQDEKTATKQAIQTLHQQLQDKNMATVGEYLNHLEREGKPTRVRRDYRGESAFAYARDMIEAEFDLIVERQKTFSSEYQKIFTPAVLENIKYGTMDDGESGFGIFWEKGIDNNKVAATIGFCCYQPEEGVEHQQRLPIASHLFQQKRLLEQINNLKIYDDMRRPRDGDGKLTLAERNIIFNHACQELNDLKGKRIKELLGINAHFTLNIDAGGGKNKGKKSEQLIKAHVALLALKEKPLPKQYIAEKWQKFSDAQKERIMELLRDTGDSADNRQQWQEEFSDFSSDLLDELEDIALPAGYAATGKTATQKLLTELQADVIPHYEAEQRAGLMHPVPKADRSKLPYYGNVPSLKSYCQGATGGDEDRAEIKFGKIPNPVVHRSMNKIRHIVNAYIKQYGMPKQIHLEMARELNKSQTERDEIDKNNKKNYQDNLIYDAQTISHGKRPSRKYRRALKLHRWQNAICPYTGATIKYEDIFNGKTDIDHILPYARTMLDSMSNLALCMSDANQFKGDQSPHEAFAGGWQYQGKHISYNDILTLIKEYPEYKKQKFNEDAMERFKGDNLFQTRFKTDTQYLAKLVRNYLGCLVDYQKDIICLTGGVTSDLRHHWGAHNILQEIDDDSLSLKGTAKLLEVQQKGFMTWLKDYQKQQQKLLADKGDSLEAERIRVARMVLAIDIAMLETTPLDQWDDVATRFYNDYLNKEGKKDRSDSRHHLLDAIVIACTNRSAVQKLNTANKFVNPYKKPEQAHEKADTRLAMGRVKNHPQNWENFRADVRKFIARPELVVQIPNKNSASRQIHKETNYKKLLDIYTIDKATKQEMYEISLVSSKSTLSDLVKGNQNAFDALTPTKDKFLDNLSYNSKKIYKDPNGKPLDKAGFEGVKHAIISQLAKQKDMQAGINQWIQQAPATIDEIKPTKDKMGTEIVTRKCSQPEKNAWGLAQYQQKNPQRKYYSYKNLAVRVLRNKFLEQDFQGRNRPSAPQRVVQLRGNSHMDIFSTQNAKGETILDWECVTVLDAKQQDFTPEWKKTYPDAVPVAQLRINDTIEIWNDPDDIENRRRILTRVQKMSDGDVHFSTIHRSKTEDTDDPYRTRISSIKSWQKYQPENIQRGFTGMVYQRQKLY